MNLKSITVPSSDFNKIFFRNFGSLKDDFASKKYKSLWNTKQTETKRKARL
jgi:hypothetical protein